jgi:Cu(I)/Ag(I) efflux system membrane protein CusA/SilA
MAAATGLSVTLVPVLLGLFVRGRLRPERDNPLNRVLIALYRPFLDWVLRSPRLVLVLALVLTVTGFWPALRLGSEFMPELDEGDLLYMPTTFPGIAPDKARQLLQQTDRLIKTVPEVERVFGKVGRAETATDPAPMEMIETLIQLKPRDQWRPGMTIAGIKAELERTVKFPGLSNAWLMPINARIQMLSTGIKTPLGVKISGPDLTTIQTLGERVEEILEQVPGTASVFSERVAEGRYIQVTPDRASLGLVGMDVADLHEIIETAVGGMNLTEVVEGRERYPVNLRYSVDFRDSLGKLDGLPIVTMGGAQIPLGDMASVELVDGPNMIRSENARLNGWVFVDIRGRDLGSYMAEARPAVAAQLKLPPGYSLTWSGEYEHWERAKQRLALVVALTLAVILMLLYLNFRNTMSVFIILATLPLGLVGGAWLMYLLSYRFSVASGIGFIALGGVAVEIGVVMLLYLDRALERRREAKAVTGLKLTHDDIREAIIEGALQRLRPVTMTKVAIIAALLPILLGSGVGSEAMQRIAAPMVGGMVSVAILTLAVFPAAYLVWKSPAISWRYPAWWPLNGGPVQPRSTDSGGAEIPRRQLGQAIWAVMVPEQKATRRALLVLSGALTALLLLGILGSVYYPRLSQWLSRNSAQAIVLHADRACHPVGKACTVSDATLTITLRLGDSLQPLKAFPVLVGLAGETKVSKVAVYFTMVNMEMGVNRFDLRQRADGMWQGQALLPVCSNGRQDWRVAVAVAGDAAYVGEFYLASSP